MEGILRAPPDAFPPSGWPTPDRGRVRFRGVDLRDRDVLELRRTACLVPQLPALLQGTVADNVRYGPLAGLIATSLGVRGFFTSEHQLRDTTAPPAAQGSRRPA